MTIAVQAPAAIRVLRPDWETSRIVVIGGGGGTGRLVVAALRRLMPLATIVVASRNAPDALRPPGADGAIAVDAGRASPDPLSIAVLQGFDLAILALGPFDEMLDRAHRLCIAAGIDCIDVNDSPAASRAILALDELAVQAGTRVLTGMGLNPGLSTVLLDDEVRLFAGGNEPSGVAATRTMIANFGPKVFEVANGEEIAVRADDRSSAAHFAFPTLPGELAAIHCSSAESALLEARGASAPRGAIDYRIHFQGMPTGMVGVFRRNAILRSDRVARILAPFFHAMHGRSRSRPGNLDRSVMAVRALPGQAGAGLTVFATGTTTFGMTAAFAAAMAKAHLSRGRETAAGVRAIGLGLPVDRRELDVDLKAAGIEIRHAA